MTEPKHGGDGFVEESNGRETMYCGVCKCGWRSAILRYDRLDAMDDYAAHITQVLGW